MWKWFFSYWGCGNRKHVFFEVFFFDRAFVAPVVSSRWLRKQAHVAKRVLYCPGSRCASRQRPVVCLRKVLCRPGMTVCVPHIRIFFFAWLGTDELYAQLLLVCVQCSLKYNYHKLECWNHHQQMARLLMISTAKKQICKWITMVVMVVSPLEEPYFTISELTVIVRFAWWWHLPCGCVWASCCFTD